MAEEKPKWRQFDKLNFDKKSFSKRVRRAEGVTTRHAHEFIIKRLGNIREARRPIIAWLLLVGFMIAAVGVQLMWFQREYETTAYGNGGTYAEATLGPIDTLNPLYAASDAEVAASRLIFSSLYTYDKTGKLIGDLAESMKVDSTGQVYTVKLRPNVHWHDGASLTAKDVAFTVNLIKDPETRSPLRVNWQDVTVKAKDDTTVIFKLPAVYAAFPYALTLSILPEHSLSEVPPAAIRENTFSRAPIGSGPFSFHLLQTANLGTGHQVVHMTSSPNYYRGKPKLSRFEVHAYTSQDDIVKALTSDEVNAAAQVPYTANEQLAQRDFRITKQPVASGVYALFNTANATLKDAKVRRALQLATETQSIREEIGANTPKLDLPFIDGQLTGRGIPVVPAPNAKKAATLLYEAGWKLKGDVRYKGKQKLHLTITTTKSDQYEKAVEVLAGQWRKVGVEVDVNVIDTSNPSTNFIQNTLQPRNYDVLLYELIIGADPDVYAYWHSSQVGIRGYNFSNYSNTTADAALASARARLEPALRNAKYKSFAKQWVRDVPAIGLYQPVAQYVASAKVKSIDPSAKIISPADRYQNVLYWSVRKEPVYKTP